MKKQRLRSAFLELIMMMMEDDEDEQEEEENKYCPYLPLSKNALCLPNYFLLIHLIQLLTNIEYDDDSKGSH